MEANNYRETTPLAHLCDHYKADIRFFESLEAYGLITLVRVEQIPSIETEQIRQVEKWIHLHYDLNINMEGLDAIGHLLDKMQRLQAELAQAKRRLSTLEDF